MEAKRNILASNIPKFGDIPTLEADIFKRMAEQIDKQREEQILERLAQLGHVFSTEEERHAFYKARLFIVSYDNKPAFKEIYLDFNGDKLLLGTYWDTIETQFNPEEPYKISVTAGNPPK